MCFRQIKFSLCVCSCVLFFVAAFAQGQVIPEDKILYYEEALLSLDTVAACPLHKIALTNDTLIVAFHQAIIHYPELCHLKIQLRYGRTKTTMAALPNMLSVFRKCDKRTYKVVVNKNQRKTQARLIYSVPFNACTGVMGHELAHILDYSNKSGWQIAWMGIRYLGKKYRRNVERQTDLTAIERGFGWQVYHYSHFVIHEAVIDEKYRRYKLDIYMKPEEIYDIIHQ